MEAGIGSNRAKIRNIGESKLEGRRRGEGSLRDILFYIFLSEAMAMGGIINTNLKAGRRRRRRG